MKLTKGERIGLIMVAAIIGMAGGFMVTIAEHNWQTLIGIVLLLWSNNVANRVRREYE